MKPLKPCNPFDTKALMEKATLEIKNFWNFNSNEYEVFYAKSCAKAMILIL